MTVSRRYAVPVIALASLAAIPIGWHAVAAPVSDACNDPEALFAALRIGKGVVDDRRPDAEGPRGAGLIGGEIPLEGGESPLEDADVSSMRFRVSRGFAPSEYYGARRVHAFDNTFAFDAETELVEVYAGGVRLPIHWLEDDLSQHLRVRAYFLAVGGRAVEHPFPAGMALAAEQLVHGTLPVTLFMLRAEGRPSGIDAMRRDARAWLRDAWEWYRKVCGS